MKVAIANTLYLMSLKPLKSRSFYGDMRSFQSWIVCDMSMAAV